MPLLVGASNDSLEISIATHPARVLAEFVVAHLQLLESRFQSVRQKDDVRLTDCHDLTGLQSELEEAVEFVLQSFVLPRRGDQASLLETVDLICVDGFQVFMGGDQEIGPLVAIDARRSPAVWQPGDLIPMPSLFRNVPESLHRSQDSQLNRLGYFPIICLPSDQVATPELFPLLLHEVGHAIDAYQDLSQTVLSQLQPVASESRYRYWNAWIEEIIADLFGLVLAGEAFGIALVNFVSGISLPSGVSTASAYPPLELRLNFSQQSDSPIRRLTKHSDCGTPRSTRRVAKPNGSGTP